MPLKWADIGILGNKLNYTAGKFITVKSYRTLIKLLLFYLMRSHQGGFFGELSKSARSLLLAWIHLSPLLLKFWTVPQPSPFSVDNQPHPGTWRALHDSRQLIFHHRGVGSVPCRPPWGIQFSFYSNAIHLFSIPPDIWHDRCLSSVHGIHICGSKKEDASRFVKRKDGPSWSMRDLSLWKE